MAAGCLACTGTTDVPELRSPDVPLRPHTEADLPGVVERAGPCRPDDG